MENDFIQGTKESHHEALSQNHWQGHRMLHGGFFHVLNVFFINSPNTVLCSVQPESWKEFFSSSVVN